MAIKSQVSALSPVGGVTRTLIDTVTLSQTAKRIIGIWVYITGSLTSGETMSGYFDLDSPDVDLKPLQLPLDVVTVLTSGAAAYSPRIFPVDIQVSGKVDIGGYVTLDSAQTGALKARFGLVYET